MNPETVAARLIEAFFDQPDQDLCNVAQILESLHLTLTMEVMQCLKHIVDHERLTNAHRALHIAQLAQHVAPTIPDPLASALAHWMHGNALFSLGHYQDALQHYQAAEHRYLEQQHQLNVAILRVNQVAVLHELGDYPGALAIEEHARAICHDLGDEAREYLAVLEMNVGAVHHQMGNWQAALAAFERGRDLFAQLHDMIEVARIDMNRAHVLEETDDFPNAEQLLLGARAILVDAQRQSEVARADVNLGMLAYRRGQYQMALRSLEAAHQTFMSIPLSGEVAVVNLYRSLVYRDLDLLHETITLAQEAGQLFRQEGMRWQEALALMTEGTGYQRLGIHTMADRLLLQAREILEQQEASIRVLMLDIERATLKLQQGDVQGADILSQNVTRQLQDIEWVPPSVNAQHALLVARCAMHHRPPHYDTAQYHLAKALDYAHTYHLSDVLITAHHLSGQIFEGMHHYQTALVHYQTAIERIEQIRADLLLDELQSGFMESQVPIYADAVRLSQRFASATGLFYLLNLASRAPLRQSVRQHPLSTSPPESEHNIIRQLQRLRETWHWYQTKLEGMGNLDAEGPTPYSPTATAEVRQRIHTLEIEMSDLMNRWRIQTTQTPSVSDDPLLPYQPTPNLFERENADAFLGHIQARLQATDALLHYATIDGRFHAIIVTATSITVIPNLADAAPLRRLHRSWRFHLEHLHLHQETPDASIQIARTYMMRFATLLLTPIERMLADYSHLYLVLPPEWHDLPFAAFFNGTHYLIERYQLTYLSSPDVLLTAAPPAREHPQALIIGCSDEGRLSHTVTEAEQIGRTLAPHLTTNVLLEESATVEQLHQATPHIHLLHCATHAVFRPDNPFFSWIRLADARLTVADLYDMTLPQHPLVILSACDTGRGQTRGGGLFGMGRAFLAAGTFGLIVGLWKVEDASAAYLMSDLYATSHPMSVLNTPAQALCAAQRRMRAQYEHPFYWAGFLFIQG